MEHEFELDISSLNPKQQEAVQTTEGPLLVVAGAGSGKTRMLTYRIAYLIRNKHIPPEAILAVTFTNKAAGEMRSRVRNLVPDSGDFVTASTFHSFCCMLLRRWGAHIGIPAGFTIYDEEDCEKLVKTICKDQKVDESLLSPKLLLELISQAKNALIEPDAFFPEKYEATRIQELYALYQRTLRDNDALDFDDLIFSAYKMLYSCPELLARLQSKYEYFLVDEYQDTNHAQYMLISLLSSKKRNICVVGDEDQSIYSWRGATIRNIRDFEKDFPGAKVIMLEQNYRSTQNILDAAGALILNNSGTYKKKLWTCNPQGNLLNFKYAMDEREEADWIVRQIIHKVRDSKISNNDCAVLFRMNSLSRSIEQALVRAGVPYEVTGGTKFFHRREVKDIVAYLRVLNNQKDSVSLKRIINVPRRGIGPGMLAKLSEPDKSLWQAFEEYAVSNRTAKPGKFYFLMKELIAEIESSSVSELAKAVLERTDYMAYLESSDPESFSDRESNIESLISDIVFQEELNPDLSLSDYLSIVSLHADTDEMDESADKVRLSTFHNAKGLEFAVVFMMAMEEGLFPHSSSCSSQAELEEERRLAYVGITRARTDIFLSAARRRLIYGNWRESMLSRFIGEIPHELFDESSFPARKKTHMRAVRKISIASGQCDAENSSIASSLGWCDGKQATMANLCPGAEVIHQAFGKGRILATAGENPGDYRVSVFFEKVGKKTLLLQYGNLRVINTQNHQEVEQ